MNQGVEMTTLRIFECGGVSKNPPDEVQVQSLYQRINQVINVQTKIQELDVCQGTTYATLEVPGLPPTTEDCIPYGSGTVSGLCIDGETATTGVISGTASNIPNSNVSYNTQDVPGIMYISFKNTAVTDTTMVGVNIGYSVHFVK